MNIIRTTDPNIPTFCNWADVAKFQLLDLLGLSPYFEIPFDVCAAVYVTREFVKMKMTEKEAKTEFSERITFDIFLFVLKLFALV